MPALEYTPGARNAVNRLAAKRAVYDIERINTLINTSHVLHVSFSPDPADPFPAILPMIGVMGSFARPSAGLDEPLDCYLHGYVSSRIMNLATSLPGGLPVCIAASKVDGLVLALTPNSHSLNYRSAVLFGHASLVESEEEKLWAMELITESVVPGRWSQTRVPPNKAEMSSTRILRVKVASGSAKVRDGPPADDRVDLGDDGVLDRVWTGVVPLVERFETPVPSSYNRVNGVPEHVTEYVASVNEANEEYRREVEGRVTGEQKRYGEI